MFPHEVTLPLPAGLRSAKVKLEGWSTAKFQVETAAWEWFSSSFMKQLYRFPVSPVMNPHPTPPHPGKAAQALMQSVMLVVLTLLMLLPSPLPEAKSMPQYRTNFLLPEAVTVVLSACGHGTSVFTGPAVLVGDDDDDAGVDEVGVLHFSSVACQPDQEKNQKARAEKVRRGRKETRKEAPPRNK